MTTLSLRTPMEELAALLASSDEAKVAAIYRDMTPEQRELVAEALTAAEQATVNWRLSPAHMAHKLTKGTIQLYPYVRLIGEIVRTAFNGTEPHQMLWMPSQYGKTTMIGNWTPIWALDRDPSMRIMYVSYDANKAKEEAGKARDLARDFSADLRFELRPDKQARGMWATPQGGGLYAVGINGGIVGWPADAILMDDLFKGWQWAHSKAIRENVWAIYRSQIRMRVQSEFCPILSVGTRWHEDDIPAKLLQLGRDEPAAYQWKVTRLAAIAEAPNLQAPDPIYHEPDPLGRQPGEVLEPRRFSEREVHARRVDAGPYLFAAMEQQRPAPPEGGELKRDWWKVEESMPRKWDELITSWDMKLKDKESGDYVVGQCWGRTGKDVWLIDQLRGQWGQAITENAIALMMVRHPTVQRHFIENTGFGPEVRAALGARPAYMLSPDIAGQLGMTEKEALQVQQLRRRGMGAILPVTPRGTKTDRMRVYTGYLEAGDVHVWARMPGLPAYLEEMASFPHGHDDQVDATSQALSKLLRRTMTTSKVARSGSLPKPTIDTRGGGTMGINAAPPRRSRLLIPRNGAPTSGR